MNATLQCFCQIENLVNYFKFNRKVDDVIAANSLYDHNKNILTSSFKYLIEYLWPTIKEFEKKLYSQKRINSNNVSYAPYDFKEKISDMNPLFAGTQANDSKDLVNFIIMTLHQELNDNYTNNIVSINISEQYNRNKELMFQYFYQKFKEENKSIISDTFYAIYGSAIKCTNCNVIKYNYQTYFFLLFPLEEVRKFKVQQNNLNIQSINFVNIYDCFEYNNRIESMDGENQMYCNECRNNFRFLNKAFITNGPKILIILLNRGKGIQFDVKLEFYEQLNLMNFIDLKDTGVIYNLIGVVTHMGLSDASGHFIACCKSPIDERWYKYNDDYVTPILNIKKEIIDYAMPYILFYQKQ